MSARHDVRKVIRAAQRLGLTVEYGRHPRLVDPRTGRAVTFSGSPSCPHAYKHLLADLRKYLNVEVFP